MSKKKIQALTTQLAINDIFGQFRYIVIDGEIWWAIPDLCKVLDLKNPTMVASRLGENERAKFNLGRSPIHGGGGEINFANEPGLYRIIFMSKKPEAKKFQDWVYHEVLPSIRKYVYYMLNKSKNMETDCRKAFAILADLDAKGIEWDLVFEDITLEYNEREKEFRPCYKFNVKA